MNQKTSIVSILKNFDSSILRKIWNKYCSDEAIEDYIYDNDEYNVNACFANNPHEALMAACYGSYNFTDFYFIINAYGNLESFNTIDIDKHIDFDILADYVMDNGCDEFDEYDLDDLRTYFEEYHDDKGSHFDLETIDEYDLVTDDWDYILGVEE